MSYSVRNFIKKNCKDSYEVEDIERFASAVSKESEGRYTINSAQKILCRYAYVNNNKIHFDIDARNSDQTLDQLKQKLVLGSRNIVINNNNDIIDNISHASDKNDKNDLNAKKIKKVVAVKDTDTYLKIQNKPDLKSDTKIEAKTNIKGGFGKLNSVKNIIRVDSDNSDSEQHNTKVLKVPKDVKKKSKSDNSDLSEDLCVVNKRSTNLFSSVQDKKQNTQTNNVAKKGGFGIFQKSSISKQEYDGDENTNKNIKAKSNVSDTVNSYLYPVEKKYDGIIRKEDKYGPYGTDNYHETDMNNDKIGEIEKKRISVYRKLASQYYPAQRSKEWFKRRDEMITASDGGTVVGLNPYEQDFGFITKKVHGKPFETSIDCYHGKKYEAVATMAYEYRMNVKVKEFGLCRHPLYKFLGASPDGIVSEFKLKTNDGRTWDEIEKEFEPLQEFPSDATNEEIAKIEKENYNITMRNRKIAEKYGVKTQYVGRMLEIKCPMRRKILMDTDAPEVYGPHNEPIKDLKKDCKKGICPAYYWVQVQLQLQCCELDECDFWQAEIFEYSDKDDFVDDTDPDCPWLSRQTGHEKGAVIQLLPFEQVANKTMEYKDRIYNFAEFIYQPKIDMTPLEVEKWILDTIQNLKQTHRGRVFERVLYWKIINTRNITILRDDKWFNDNLSKFSDAWDMVEYFRRNKDRSKLLKKYLAMQKKDCYGNIKEKIPGTVMETIKKLYNEPSEDASNKEHKLYAKFIANLEKDIEDSGIEEPKEYDVRDDIEYIKNALDMKIPEDIDEEEKADYQKKFIEFIKQMKANVDSYLFQEESSNKF